MDGVKKFPIALTIPFVNYIWRTDLFNYSVKSDDEAKNNSISDRLRSLLQKAGIENRLPDILHDLATRVEHFENSLKDINVRKFVGLVPEKKIVGDGYGLEGRPGGRFADALVMSAVLDRFLAARLGKGSLQLRQSLHPRSAKTIPLVGLEYVEHLKNLKRLQTSLDITKSFYNGEEFRLELRDDLEAGSEVHVAKLSALCTGLDGQAYLSKVASNIILMAVAILVLSKVSHSSPVSIRRPLSFSGKKT